MKRRLLVILGSLALLLAATTAWAQHDATNAGIVQSDHPAINYLGTPTTDPAEMLNRKLASGEVKLKWDDKGGYLQSLLKALDVNQDSQVMVFSKTSFQAVRISPRTPRAVYFNDVSTVGFVQGSDVLELATLDPKQGYIFYTFTNHKNEKPTIDRRDVCLQCHHGPATAGVPGIMVASVFPDASGMPYARAGMPATDHRTRFEERWGGWYVTGTHGGQRHRGNAMVRDRNAPDVLDQHDTQNQMNLNKKFDVGPYLQPTSDIVALLTLEHQTRMTNMLTRIGWEYRIAEQEKAAPDSQLRKDLAIDIENVVRYMTFADEAPLVDTVIGASTFQKTFPQRGLRDEKGRSLRDYDLQTRLFKYPLSYMIYTELFDALPKPVQDKVYSRLIEVLSGKDQRPEYAKLNPEASKAALQILAATKKNVPETWLAAAK
jgi:hypothetical protein